MNPYVHPLTIRRVWFNDTPGARDEAGQPLRTYSTEDVAGLVQPHDADETPDSRSAGTVLADWVIFLPLGTKIAHEDEVVWGDRRLQVVDVRPFQYGGLAHLEVDAKTVSAANTDEDGS